MRRLPGRRGQVERLVTLPVVGEVEQGAVVGADLDGSLAEGVDAEVDSLGEPDGGRVGVDDAGHLRTPINLN
ncbi:hypothetical protein [Streptomyces sp. NPDC053431]|uniref:hypothetical protein n=1 Tax=Streptomyces sp. NPDC053431 TaxID=3365703 RepID=UPI0037D2A67F